MNTRSQAMQERPAKALLLRAIPLRRASAILFVILLALAIAWAAVPAVRADIAVETYNAAESFFITADPSPLLLCSCQSFSGSLSITNTGAFPVTLALTALPQGIPVRLSDTTVEVKPGGSTSVTYTVDAACSATLDSTLRIIATSGSGKSASLERQLRIGKCQNLAADATITMNTTTLEPCQAVDGQVIVQNIGTFPETYTLGFEGKQIERSSLGKSSVVLGANEFQRIPFTLQFSCGLYGNASAQVTIDSLKNNLETVIPLSFWVNRDYPYALRIPSSKQVCEQDSVNLVASLENTGRLSNTYKLSYQSDPPSSSQFVTFPSQGSLTLDPGDESSLLINLYPKKGHAGNYTLTITSVSDLGGVEQTVHMPLLVTSCYDITLSTPSSPLQCSGSFSQDVQVKNNGAFPEEVALSLAGPSYFHLSRTTLTLNPGETRTVAVEGNVPDATANASITVVATLHNGVSFSTGFVVRGISQQDCHAVRADSALKVTLGQEKIPVKLTSEAYDLEDYQLEIRNASAWVRLTSNAIEMLPGNSTIITLAANPQSDTLPGTYRYTIVATPLSNPDVSYDLPIVIELVRPSFVSRVWSFVSLHRCAQIGLALLFVFLAFLVIFIAIDKERVTRKFRKEHKAAIRVLVALAVLFVLLLVFLFFNVNVPRTYPALPTHPEPLSFTWYQGDHYSIDLTQYFYSPEGEKLIYSSSVSNGHISVSIDQKGIATFLPERKFAGNALVTFTATDETNRTTSSPTFNLNVLPVSTPSFPDLLLAYCEFTHELLYGLLFFTLYGIVLLRKRKTE